MLWYRTVRPYTSKKPLRKRNARATVQSLFALLMFLKILRPRTTGVAMRNHKRNNLVLPTVTYLQIGEKVRLGNQLFQIASTIGLAEMHGYRWDFPTSIDHSSAGKLFRLRGHLLDSADYKVYKELTERHYSVTLPPLRSGETLSLDGYFQSHQYFSTSVETLREFLVYPERRLKRIRHRLPEVKSASTAVMHVRRGDYLRHGSKYNVLRPTYYREALSRLERVDTVIIVTDDKAWCKKELLPFLQHLQYKTILSPFSNEYDDFLLLALGKSIIIANSTFSWWAAFLRKVFPQLLHTDSPEAKVIAPLTWYNLTGEFAFLNREALFPEDWITIENSSA